MTRRPIRKVGLSTPAGQAGLKTDPHTGDLLGQPEALYAELSGFDASARGPLLGPTPFEESPGTIALVDFWPAYQLSWVPSADGWALSAGERSPFMKLGERLCDQPITTLLLL